MCLLAAHAGRGFSVISVNSPDSGSERKVQTVSLAPRKLIERARGSRTTTVSSQAASSLFTACSRLSQRLTCAAVCSSPALNRASTSRPGKTATTTGGNEVVSSISDASSLARPLTTLLIVGASLLLLTAQPGSAETSLKTVASAALQQQQQPVPGNKLETLELAELSKAAFAEQDDPVNPFTLFGTTRKKFLIENLQGTKVISRKKGFTTTTCVSGVAIGQQTKRFEALPESAKSNAADNQLCSKTTGPDLVPTCNASCAQACTAALSEYADRDSRLTGYSIDSKTKDKLATSCTKQCTYECAKPGDKYGFAIPYRSRE